MTRDEAGFSLIEVIVAVVVLAVGLIGASRVWRASFTAAASTTDRANATVLANNLVSQAAAYGCGLETGVAVPAGGQPNASQPGAPTAASVEQRCAAVYGNAATLGDPPRYTTTVGGIHYAVVFRTAWVTATGSCPSTEATPVGAAQDVTISWSVGGVDETLPDTTFALVPGGTLYRNTADGQLELTGMAAGSLATVAIPGWSTIERFATTSGCAWFPFLPAESGYTVSYFPTGATGGSPGLSTTVAVNADALTKVAA